MRPQRSGIAGQHAFGQPPLFNRRELGGMVLALACASDLTGATDVGQALEASLRKHGIPAAAAMAATSEKVVYSGAFGRRDARSKLRVTTESIFGIASMTKAIASTAAMQLVEQGRLTLDEPVSTHLPELAALNVLEGFDKQTGKPILRSALTPVTLRHLLSHTSGFAYDTWNETMARYVVSVLPGSSLANPIYPTALWGRMTQPVICEPGTCWQYGTNADWTARLIEVVSGQTLNQYFQTNIFGPLGMKDTGYTLSPTQFDRMVSLYTRQKDGSLAELTRKPPAAPDSFWGGAGLYSTVGDYTRFMQMFLRRGSGPRKEKILRPETVNEMATNQIGGLSAGKMRSYKGEVWHDVTFHPGFTDGFGLGFLINSAAYDGGRSAGSLTWAGGWNTFFWIDLKQKLCGVLMMQFQPFYDAAAVSILNDFEQAVYRVQLG